MGSTRVCAFLQVCRLEYPMGSKQASPFESFFVQGLLGFRPSKSTVLRFRVLGLGFRLGTAPTQQQLDHIIPSP